jgi:hypothetical protein
MHHYFKASCLSNVRPRSYAHTRLANILFIILVVLFDIGVVFYYFPFFWNF